MEEFDQGFYRSCVIPLLGNTVSIVDVLWCSILTFTVKKTSWAYIKCPIIHPYTQNTFLAHLTGMAKLTVHKGHIFH